MSSKRTNLTSAIRKSCWLKNIGRSFNGECMTGCGNLIDVYNYECGHIKSVEDGGLNEITNLKPICSNCNSSMGATNMIEFISKSGFIPRWNISENTLLKYELNDNYTFVKLPINHILIPQTSFRFIYNTFDYISHYGYVYHLNEQLKNDWTFNKEIELKKVNEFINLETLHKNIFDGKNTINTIPELLSKSPEITFDILSYLIINNDIKSRKKYIDSQNTINKLLIIFKYGMKPCTYDYVLLHEILRILSISIIITDDSYNIVDKKLYWDDVNLVKVQLKDKDCHDEKIKELINNIIDNYEQTVMNKI